MKEFRTTSITMAVFVQLTCNITAEIRPSHAAAVPLFVFPDSPEVSRAAAQYYNDGVIPAREFSRTIGMVRAKCREMNLYEEHKRAQGGARSFVG
jgi:hypothetical protein